MAGPPGRDPDGTGPAKIAPGGSEYRAGYPLARVRTSGIFQDGRSDAPIRITIVPWLLHKLHLKGVKEAVQPGCKVLL